MKPRTAYWITFAACLALLVAMGALLLFGCTPPALLPTANVYVVNSAWDVVREEFLARALTSTDELQAAVEEYNATHTDDQWRLIEGEVPPIEEAPTADAYIVTSDTHEETNRYLGVARADLVERRTTWRLQVELDSQAAGVGCVLYVDNVPPAPTPPVPVDPYVQYAIYVIDAAGAVLFEEHPSAEQYHSRLTAWSITVELNNQEHPEAPWSLVTGRVYP